MDENRTKALNNALQMLDKKYGGHTVMRLGERPDMHVDGASTGLVTVDAAIGVGGLPKGRITEIYGPESSGKTTVALMVIAESQKNGGICAFIDAEHALDPVYAKALGVNTDELYVSQPDNGEQALEITEMLISSGAIDVIVIDSVAALVPRAEIEGDMGKSMVGLHARLMSQALRKLASIINQTKTVAIFINQLREKIGDSGFGRAPMETTTGGKALKFYTSVRLDVRRKEKITNGSDVIGYKTKIKVVKNKVAPPFKFSIVEMINGIGFDKIAEIIDLAIQNNIVNKSGAWFTYNEERFHGLPSLKSYFQNDQSAFEKIKCEVLNKDISNSIEEEKTIDITISDDTIDSSIVLE